MAENKMEQVDFWIRYFKEHTNTIGCVELDGLDCREVLALLQELADKKVDKPNKMEQVAALFGKELGEQFKVKLPTEEFILCRFSEKRLWYWWRDWYISDKVLAQLIAGEAVIVDE